MNILFIVGSLRKGSFNRILADEAMKALESHPDVTVRWLDYSDLPLFNAEQTYPFSEAAESARAVIRDAQALWIFCPEYNGSVPGVLKNLLDYASLANKPNDFSSGTPLMNKPVAQAGAGGSFGTARAQKELTTLLENCKCKVMTSPITEIKLPASAFSTGKWTPDENTLKEISDEASAFIEFVKKTLDIHR